MRFKIFLYFLIIFLLNIRAFGVEPLIKYNIDFQVDNSGNRKPDSFIDQGGQNLNIYRNTGYSVLNPNSIKIGDKDDCFPDDLDNPEGNILLSGTVKSKETNRAVNGAVVAVYMGSEHMNNIAENVGSVDRFVVGEGERLNNLYYYDITRDGKFTVYACNDYKRLSNDKVNRYGDNFCVEGYSKTGTKCTHFDYVKAYPKFYVAVICGMSGYERNPRTDDLDNYRQEMENAKLKPWIGEIYSIDNYNEPYKGANRPDFLSKRDFNISVNCDDDLQPFPVPMFLEYTSNNNIASCRMDDVSPNLINYFKKIQAPLRSSLYTPADAVVAGSNLIPSKDSLPDCADPDNPLCAKNFITKAFPEPDKQKNFFDYGNKPYLVDSTSLINANPVLREEVFSYDTSKGLHGRKIDFDDGNLDGDDYLPVARYEYKGQVDGKLDAKTAIEDVKFDINTLKDLYACFTTFNFPVTKSSAEADEVQLRLTDPAKGIYFTPNIRVPTCKELFCGGQFMPDRELCTVRVKTSVYGENVEDNPDKSNFTVLNALHGYGPGVTMSLRTHKDITLELMGLVNELINSDFNPKKPIPGVNTAYKPVSKVSEIIACFADDGKPVLLNEDGSIDYQTSKGTKNFFSPVPMISFLSIPYNMDFMHAISNDNYANKPGGNSFFSEECNYGDPNSAENKDRQFANCRSAVIPGGVYSISALRVIANMCNRNTKLPTLGETEFTNKIEYSTVNQEYGKVEANEKRVELAMTKIGTPISLCLCDPNSPTPGCTPQTNLNNKIDRNFGTASFVGNNDQNRGNNILGGLCNMTKGEANDGANCSDFIGESKYNLKDSTNFVGGNANLKVSWAYSHEDLRGRFEEDFYTHYVVDENGGNEPQRDFAELINLNSPIAFRSVIEGQAPVETFLSDRACTALYDETDRSNDRIPDDKEVGDCKSYAYFVKAPSPQNISSLEKPTDLANPSATETPTITLTEIVTNRDTGRKELRNIGTATLYQKTKDGTSGYVYTKYQYVNQKYDPIPDLLNEFRKYTVFGNIPVGGSQICKTPKLATLVDFKTTEFTSNSRRDGAEANEDGLSLNFSTSRGAFCNEVIPEELDRCENKPDNSLGDDVTKRDRDSIHGLTPANECKLRKCLTLCNQLYPTYEFYSNRSGFFSGLIESSTSPAFTVSVPTDPATGNPLPHYNSQQGVNEIVYFCKNTDPKAKNVALEMNKGDEGCVLDYTRNIRNIYVLPENRAINTINEELNPLYSKFNYPVYNNQLCVNPINQLNFSERDKNSNFNDSLNCKPYIGPQRPKAFE